MKQKYQKEGAEIPFTRRAHKVPEGNGGGEKKHFTKYMKTYTSQKKAEAHCTVGRFTVPN